MDEIDFEVQRWSELIRTLIIRICLLHIHIDHISQMNHRKADRTLPGVEVEVAVAVEGRPQYPVGTTRLEDAVVAVVAEAIPRNFHLPRHCLVSGTRNDHSYGRSSLSGLSRLPHFFKRPRNSLSLPSEIQVRIPCPQSNILIENP